MQKGCQGVHLALVGQQIGQHGRQLQHLRRKACVLRLSGGILMGFRIGDLEAGQHGLQSFGPVLRCGQFEGHGSVADLALGSHQPLRKRRLLDQEGARDLDHA